MIILYVLCLNVDNMLIIVEIFINNEYQKYLIILNFYNIIIPKQNAFNYSIIYNI